MKKVFILSYSWEKILFINFNNLKKYLKENIFPKLNISKKEIKSQISLLTLKKSYFVRLFKLWIYF